MIFEQHYLGCLSHASYLIGDEKSRRAVVVDPQRDVERYLESAKKHGLALEHVFLTHLHADFVSGHLELAQRTGAAVHLGPGARVDYACELVRSGDVFQLGAVRLEVLETPGHTLESISLLVFDEARDRRVPHAVLTGDALFLGDVGRPDLQVATGVSAEELAGRLYDTLRRVFMHLPDETRVYPAHGAGSACGRNISNDLVGTLGQQRATNWALQPMSKQEFVHELTRDMAPAPAYFAFDAQLNRSERERLDRVLERGVRGLTLSRLKTLHETGTVVLDTREPDDYARGHWRRSINVGLSGRFASWVGTVIEPGSAIAIVAAPGRERESVLRLGRIGFDRVEGCLEGGPEALAAAPPFVGAHRRVNAAELAGLLAVEPETLLLDVRTPREFAQGRVPGSTSFPLETLQQHCRSLPRGRKLAIHCQGGYRSSIAASLLEREGFQVCADLVGGFVAWKAAGLPVTAP
jgi:glyoxylase-like metal-dependent hydrolase (beta-lactamase superfamily II)/rhodanese-related sulfurtransferase